MSPLIAFSLGFFMLAAAHILWEGPGFRSMAWTILAIFAVIAEGVLK